MQRFLVQFGHLWQSVHSQGKGRGVDMDKEEKAKVVIFIGYLHINEASERMVEPFWATQQYPLKYNLNFKIYRKILYK